MLVRDVMTRHYVRVHPSDSIAVALQIMLWGRFRHLPVISEQGLVGVLSERDILRFRAEHAYETPMERPVMDAMTRDVVSTNPEESVDDAAEKLAGQSLGCLPVLKEGELVGILTRGDLLKRHATAIFAHRVEGEPNAADIMTPAPLAAHPDDLLLDAVSKMSQAAVRHLPVVDGEGALIGMLSDRDVRPPEHTRTWENLRVSDVMSREVGMLRPTEPLSTVEQAFSDWHFSALPVVDEQKRVLGVISYVDVIRVLAEQRKAAAAHA